MVTMPSRCASCGVAMVTVCSAEGDRAAIGLLRAGEDLEERRLAGAVLAEQRMDLARQHLEVDIVERLHAGKALADPGHA